MSQEEQESVIGKAVHDLAEAKSRQGCWRAKAATLADGLRKAATALDREDDYLHEDLTKCPERQEVEDAFAGLRRERNIIKNLTEKLAEMAPGVQID